MSVVLLKEFNQAEVQENSESFIVAVSVMITGHEISFNEQTESGVSEVTKDRVRLIGKAGTLRKFKVLFQLVPPGYRFDSPALQIFQGHPENQQFDVAGFEVETTALTTATLTLFNRLPEGTPPVESRFALFLIDPLGNHFSDDPTIVWDPPNG